MKHRVRITLVIRITIVSRTNSKGDTSIKKGISLSLASYYNSIRNLISMMSYLNRLAMLYCKMLYLIAVSWGFLGESDTWFVNS